jgi:hypothetical protein
MATIGDATPKGLHELLYGAQCGPTFTGYVFDKNKSAAGVQHASNFPESLDRILDGA